ncbi:MAG: EMC3/TMCO1 family protein [Candidatus Thermoplasmatota archaeon]|nr:EMC3/TMCO1 family protein [Candidatus Thermoplasmatota archaeon]
MAQQSKKQPNTLGMFLPLLATFGVLMVFKYLPPIFTPFLFAIGGSASAKYPVIVIFLASVVTGLVSTVVRHFFTDYVATARMQHVMGAFQKELRDAQMKKDMTRMKKLQEHQQELMMMQTSSQSNQMKSTLPTMLVSVPIFSGLMGLISGYSNPFADGAWVAPLLDPSAMTIQAPWGPVILSGAGSSAFLFPNYIWIYMIFSFVLGSVFGRTLRLIKFRKYTPKETPEEIIIMPSSQSTPAPLALAGMESDAYMNMTEPKFKKWAAKQLKAKGYAVYKDATVNGIHIDMIAAGDGKAYGFICRSLPGKLDMKSKTYRDETGLARMDFSEEISKMKDAMTAAILSTTVSAKLLLNGSVKNPDETVMHYNEMESIPSCQNPMPLDFLGRQAEDLADEQ